MRFPSLNLIQSFCSSFRSLLTSFITDFLGSVSCKSSSIKLLNYGSFLSCLRCLIFKVLFALSKVSLTILSHSSPFVKNFFIFFSELFQFRLPPLSRQLCYYIKEKCRSQGLFSSFFLFYSLLAFCQVSYQNIENFVNCDYEYCLISLRKNR